MSGPQFWAYLNEQEFTALLREAWEQGETYGILNEQRGPGETIRPTFDEWVARRLGREWVAGSEPATPDR